MTGTSGDCASLMLLSDELRTVLVREGVLRVLMVLSCERDETNDALYIDEAEGTMEG